MARQHTDCTQSTPAILTTRIVVTKRLHSTPITVMLSVTLRTLWARSLPIHFPPCRPRRRCHSWAHTTHVTCHGPSAHPWSSSHRSIVLETSLRYPDSGLWCVVLCRHTNASPQEEEQEQLEEIIAEGFFLDDSSADDDDDTDGSTTCRSTGVVNFKFVFRVGGFPGIAGQQVASHRGPFPCEASQDPVAAARRGGASSVRHRLHSRSQRRGLGPDPVDDDRAQAKHTLSQHASENLQAALPQDAHCRPAHCRRHRQRGVRSYGCKNCSFFDKPHGYGQRERF